MTRECKFCTSANPGECFVRYWNSQGMLPFWEFVKEQIYRFWEIYPSKRNWYSQLVRNGYFEAVRYCGNRYYITVKLNKEGTEANIVVSEVK